MAPAQRFSGMQKQVLGLYRGFLRAARLKKLEDRRRIELIVSTEFRNNATSVDRKDFLYIEYLLRRGHKQLELLRNSGTVGLSVVKGTADMVAIQFFWKNRHPRIQATASQLFGNPKIPCSRSNLCGELMKTIVFPTHAVEEAVNRVVNAGPDPEIALPMQVHTSR